MGTRFGIDLICADRALQQRLRGKRLALVGHPASVTADLIHSLDALAALEGVQVVAAFGPQHGMRGDKQDNMIESADYVDPHHGIPVYSLYGETRYPSARMLEGIDLVLFDLQALGCRIYTYVTTLKYFLEACSNARIALWILDRPNPTGRLVDGLTLLPGEESFVGCDEMPMAYGMTNGELAAWLCARNGYDLELETVPVTPYDPAAAPGFGWPAAERSWVNPSPNAASLNMARCFPGTVLLEGTTLSEGRGTTIPLEVAGAPDLDFTELRATMARLAPEWLQGAVLRPCFFEPQFHKHQGSLCSGLQIHADGPEFHPARFSPFRLVALLLKAVRAIEPAYELWRRHEYEYESGRLPIDVINGGPALREWIDDPAAGVADLEAQLRRDHAAWREAQAPFLRY